ncbi:MAG: MalY/PatB family protein [Peptoniphilaceae bacterium]
MYNFDEVIDRSNTDSIKYEELDNIFGNPKLKPFWVADMEFKIPDFAIDTLIKRSKHGIFGYTKRSDSYYDAIINWLRKRHNLKVTKNEIEYGPGVVFLLNMMVRLFTKEKDKIIIQTPVYYPFFDVIKNNKRIIVENKLVENNGNFTMDFKDLEDKAKDPDVKMLILCSPHNPVGRVWSKEELIKLGKICIENNVLVVSDEVHFDLVYKPYKHTSFASISEEFKTNSITCTAPSKTFNIAGLKSSYCIISDTKKMDQYKNELNNLFLNHSNVFSREITEDLYRHGEKWLEELLIYLQSNIEFAYQYFSNNIKTIVPIKLQGTYLMFLDCRKLGLNRKELVSLFINAGLALDSGHWFGSNGEGFMRLNLACPQSLLEKGLKLLEKEVNKL